MQSTNLRVAYVMPCSVSLEVVHQGFKGLQAGRDLHFPSDAISQIAEPWTKISYSIFCRVDYQPFWGVNNETLLLVAWEICQVYHVIVKSKLQISSFD